MASYVPPKKNDSNGYVFYVSLVSQADTKLFQVNPTLAAGDVKIAIDDAAPANLGTLPVVDADFTKRVKVTLSQSETNGDVLSLIFSDAAGAEWCDRQIDIHTATRRIDDLTYPATSGRSLAVDASGRVDLGLWLGTAPLALSSQLVQAIESTLEARLSATRAGYLDNLSAGAVALEATLTAMKGAGWTTETLKALYDQITAAISKAIFDLS